MCRQLLAKGCLSTVPRREPQVPSRPAVARSSQALLVVLVLFVALSSNLIVSAADGDTILSTSIGLNAGGSALSATADAASSRTAAVRVDERYFVPEHVNLLRKPRLLGNFTSLLDPSVTWATVEDQQALLDQLMSRPIAAGTLNTMTQSSQYHQRSATAVPSTAKGTAANGTHRRPLAGAPQQQQPKLNIIYIKHVDSDDADDGEADVVAAEARADIMSAPKYSDNENQAAASRAAWKEVKARSVLSHIRTKVLGNDPVAPSGSGERPAHARAQAARSATAAASVTATESLIKVHQRKARIPVTVTGDQVVAIAYDVTAGNTFNTVVQLPNSRFDDSVDALNCQGFYLTAEVRTNNPISGRTSGEPRSAATAQAAQRAARMADDGFGDADDDGGFRPVDSRDTGNQGDGGDEGNSESFSAVWKSFAQMFDTSAFCEVKSALPLRVTRAKLTTTYYVVLRSHNYGSAYEGEGGGSTCKVDVFLDQTPAKRLQTLQILFALVVPLLLLFVPLPFELWRGDIIQVSMLDIDFADWIFYPPLLLRRKIVQGCVKLYGCLTGILAARRARQHQAQLERQQQELAVAMEAQFAKNVGAAGGPAPGATNDPVGAPAVREPPLSAGAGGWGAGGTAGWGSPLQAPAPAGEAAVRRPLFDPHSPASASSSPKDSLLMHALEPAAGATRTRRSSGAHTPRDSSSHRGPSSATAQGDDGADEVVQVDPNCSTSSGPVTLRDSFADTPPREQREAHCRGGAGGVTVSTEGLLFSADVHPRSRGDPPTKDSDAAAAAVPVAGSASREGADNPPQSVHRQREEEEPHKGGKAQAAAEGSDEQEEEEERFCRICREDGSEEALVAPCACTGSVRWVHRTCLDHWRLESAKRNMNNVNKCEICKHDFTIGIRKSTLFWRSSKQVIDGVLLFLTSFFALFLITTLSHSTFGELSCLADYHDVSYSTMYLFEGLTLSVFLYLLCLVLVLFSTLVVYSWFRSRPDVEAYIQETHMRPPFLTNRNVILILVVSCVMTLQGLSLGYLIKFFLYYTSDIVWNWEASPLLGGMMFMLFMTCALGFSVWLRDSIEGFRSRRNGNEGAAEDVVVEATAAAAAQTPPTAGASNEGPSGSGASPSTAGATGNGAATGPQHAPHETDQQQQQQQEQQPQEPRPGQAGDEDYTRQFTIPPDQRVIRAFEYCPPRRTTRL